MSSILTIHAKGNSKTELNKSFEIIDAFMNNQNTLFTLISSTDPNFNPRIYYSETTIITKSIHDLASALKTDKTVNQVVKAVSYSGNLNKF